jgi:hypothetical protein
MKFNLEEINSIQTFVQSELESNQTLLSKSGTWLRIIYQTIVSRSLRLLIRCDESGAADIFRIISSQTFDAKA